MPESEAGKGSDPRPMDISREEYETKYDKINWGKNNDS